MRACVRASYRVATVAASPSLHPITCLRVRFDSTNSPGKKTQPAATKPAMAPLGSPVSGHARAYVCFAPTRTPPDGLKVGDKDVSRSSEGGRGGGGATCQSANTSDLQPFNLRRRELNVLFLFFNFKKKLLLLTLSSRAVNIQAKKKSRPGL